jgi:hypothetical protein
MIRMTNRRKFTRYTKSKTKSMTGIGPLKNSVGLMVLENI